ncbi:MAG: DUF1287 domain-containing protein [Bacteroidales bacterium]|jgi:uncharacterized protein YijF (DUF1287 family)|nr:DUF1287 domain-containing protein [Bacteroidales bacterium]
MRFLISIIFIFCSLFVFAQEDFYSQLADSAMNLEDATIIYDPSYASIEYPGGDVPADRGVCSDVVIRSYRMFGIDLQREVHEDMKANFSEYPDIWGLSAPDKNIDHRRVPNLMKFFERHGTIKPNSLQPNDYSPGDIVCWDLGGGVTHIGIVLKERSRDGKRHLVIHNIGGGQVIEDILFDFEIIGHYTYK